MTIGLILLAIVAILIFFGATESFFRKIGLKNWLAFVLVVGLVVGAIVPKLEFGFFGINIGGFIIPFIAMIVFLALMREKGEVFRSLIAIIAVAATAVTTRMLIEPSNAGLILSSSLIIGFAGGSVAYLAARTRSGALASVIGGILLGDIIINFIMMLVLGSDTFVLGSYGVFDSLIIGSVFAMILTESLNAIKRMNTHRRILNTTLSTEAAVDNNINVDKNEAKTDTAALPDYDGFFDEFI